jgi:hypothetical protein
MKRYIKDNIIKHRNQIIIYKDGKQIICPKEETLFEEGWEEYVAPGPNPIKPTIVEISDEQKLEMARDLKINDLYEYVLTTYGGAKEVKVINTELEYATLGSDRAYEVYEHINGNYYNFDTEIIVTTFEEEAKPTEADKHVVITTEKPSVMDEIKDTVNEWVDGFKDKFENNDAFKTVSILLGTILGVFLVLGIIKIFKKIFRWLGR